MTRKLIKILLACLSPIIFRFWLAPSSRHRTHTIAKCEIFFRHWYFSNSIYISILDRHHVWRSHDPTSVQTFDFCEKKDVIPPFLKKMQLFFILNIHVIQPILLVGPANEQTKASHLLLWVDFQIAPPSKQIMSLKRRLEQDFRPGNADKWIVEFL